MRRLTVEDVVMVLSPSQTTKLESLVRMPSTSNKNKALASMSVPPIFFEILCGLLLSSYLPILHPGPQGIGEMPSSPDPRPPIFFEILCGLLLSSSANKSDRDGLGHVLPFSIPACQGRPPIFFEISGCIARFFRNPLRPWWPLFVLWRASSRGRPFEGFPDASPGVLQGTRIKATKGGVCIEELQK